MMRHLFIITLLVFAKCDNDYMRKRSKMLLDESRIMLGGETILNDKEMQVNNCLMQLKFRETDYDFNNPEYFNFTKHYFLYKDKMRESKVYKIIKDMPKGGALHIHDMAILGPDYLLNLTYRDSLYGCFGEKKDFIFSNKKPTSSCTTDWILVSDARKSANNITKFDEDLKKHFSIVVDNPDEVYPTIKDSWGAFLKYFNHVYEILTYRPVWEQYFYDVLKTFRDDNIMYVEVRTILPSLYELDGTIYDPMITAKAYKKSISKFVKDYPDFVGAKIIYAPSRRVNNTVLIDYIEKAKEIKRDMNEYFAGFDLVGQEDLGNPLVLFAPQLLDAAKDLNYFFHAGETDWYGTSTDQNLVDAILLGAKRLGHAYALSKHPLLIQEVINRKIALEVNVISNAVLSLVKDVRNHPLSTFLAQGLPVVLSSDDPGAWDAKPLSDDFYVAFVAVSSRLSDLRLLKTLAINSLKYSALEPHEKINAVMKFNDKWASFINKFDCSAY